MSEKTALERAVEALEMADNADWHEKQNKDYDGMVRVVLAAIRDPSEVMRKAWSGPEPWDADARDVWHAMIDAALSE